MPEVCTTPKAFFFHFMEHQIELTGIDLTLFYLLPALMSIFLTCLLVKKKINYDEGITALLLIFSFMPVVNILIVLLSIAYAVSSKLHKDD